MPYKSARQRAYMHAQHPEIAKKWDKKYGSKIGSSKKSRDARLKALKKG